MLIPLSLIGLLGLAAAQVQEAFMAKTFTGWDCCKPVCANAPTFQSGLLTTRGAAISCSADNTPLPFQQSLTAQSSCAASGGGAGGGGAAFLCSAYQPIPVSDGLSYGFATRMGGAASADNPYCCRCYEAEWLSGAAAGRTMVLQVVNIADGAGPAGDVAEGDLIVLTPGGGVGPWTAGCTAQYGLRYEDAWGEDYGGVSSGEACAALPGDLQGGCYWRYNWAGGALNGWDVMYRPVSCPARLTDISGCAA